MNQRTFSPGEIAQWKKEGKFDVDFESLTKTFAGFTYDFLDKKTFDDTPEERRALFHDLLIEKGGFRYWLNTYSDMLFDEKANREAYNFWRDAVRARIKDKRKAEIMAPTEPIHPWGTKRPSLEQHIYETISQDNCTLIDITADPIAEFTETGIITESGHKADFDLIALATGFDAVTGSLSQIDIQSPKGGNIADHWKDGLRTSMGIAMNGFPNMYFLYGPQAPTAFSNGPSCVQFQARWLAEHLKGIKEAGITRVEATDEMEKEWTRRTHEAWDATLFPQAKSWYQGANIPGRKVEPLNW